MRIAPIVAVVLLSRLLTTCSAGTIEGACTDGVMIDGFCRPYDCPTHDCPEGFVCAVDRCVEIACLRVECEEGKECAGGKCYPADCEWRNCPGVGEVCIDEECQNATCIGVECPEGQRCAAGQCYPIDCETKNCPGYGEVCIDEECVERGCVGITCPEGQRCAGGFCYPEDCGEVGCFGEGEVCIDGVCQRRACVGIECQPGFRCANGWCYPEDCPDRECSDFGEVCFQGECVHVDCVGVECPSGERCARGECFPEVCGDRVCDSDEVCYQGRCIRRNCVGVQCPPGQKCADGECFTADCTQEGYGCGDAEVCIDGECVPGDCAHVDCPTGEVCGSDLNCYPADCATPCGPYELCVNGECVDRLCVDVTCPPGELCVAGNCYPPDCLTVSCGPDEICENGICVQLECAGGRCCPAVDCTVENQCLTDDCDGIVYTCVLDEAAGAMGWSETGDACDDGDPCTLDDRCTMGACIGTDMPCDPGEICVNGECRCGGLGPDCTGGETCCGTECADLNTSLSHCGACGSVCQRDHATETCAGGVCSLGQCDDLWEDCNGLDADGCEVSLESLTNCGACGVPCSRSHATASCSGGSCHIGSCDQPWGNCDGVDSNGCELELVTMDNCGGCGQVCSLAHATETCTSGGSCVIVSCDTLWGDCDGVDSTGCESSLETTANCGSCGSACSLPHASETCAGGNCRIDSCNSGYWNVNGSHSDGCECGDTSDVAGSCSSGAGVGTVSSSSANITRSGVIVHRTGYREEVDCYRVTYSRPDPGSGTFRIRLNPNPGNLTFSVWKGGCSNQVCGSDTTFTSTCSSQGSTCQSGNGDTYNVCVRAASGQNNLCQGYTIQFQWY